MTEPRVTRREGMMSAAQEMIIRVSFADIKRIVLPNYKTSCSFLCAAAKAKAARGRETLRSTGFVFQRNTLWVEGIPLHKE